MYFTKIRIMYDFLIKKRHLDRCPIYYSAFKSLAIRSLIASNGAFPS